MLLLYPIILQTFSINYLKVIVMKTLIEQSFSFAKTTIILVLFFLVSHSVWSQYYWVGGSGNWSDYESHWATSSGGSTFHSAEPTENDDVIFDANSFSETGQIVTIDVSQANCNSMDWSGVTNNPAFDGKSINGVLNIFGSLALSADMNCNLAFVELESDEAGNTITTSGTHLGTGSYLRFYGSGSWDLQDVLNVRYIQFIAGTINTNSNNINADQSFRPSGTKTKVFNAGSSVITTGQWRIGGSNNTLNMGTSTIVTGSFYADEEGSGPYTYHNVEIRDGGSLNNTCTINKLTLGNGGFIGSSIRVESGATIQFNELMITATKHVPLDIHSSDPGVEAIFEQTSGSVNVSNVILADIHATGGASFIANPGLDNGNNTGWTFTPFASLNYYWVGDGGDWSDYENHWATASGGSEFHEEVPSLFDAVYFNENSFTQNGQKVEIDTASSCASIDFTGVSNLPNINANYENPLTVYGSVKFNDDMTGFLYNLRLNGSNATNTIEMGGVRAQNFYIYGYSEWNLLSDISPSNFGIYDGVTLNTNGYDILTNYGFNIYGKDITVALDSSQLSARDFNIRYQETNVDFGTSEITVSRKLDGNGFHYYKVILEESATIYDENTFEYLEVLPGADAKLESGLTQTVNQDIILHGIPGQPINFAASAPGTQATLSMSSGTVNGTWLILQDMNAVGGAVFNALESVDNGNNTGWNIAVAVPLDYYWVGGNGNWSDYANHWATSSGGSTFRSREPASMDNVYFDANSFSAEDQTVTIDGDEVTFNDMSWEGAKHMPSLYGNDKTMNIYGSLTLIPDMLVYVRDFNFFSNQEADITAGQSGFPGTSSYFHFLGSGTWALQDSLTLRELNIHSGTFKTSDNWMHVNFRLSFFGSEMKTLDLGSSTIFTRGLSWSGTGDSLTIKGADSHIMFSGTFAPESFSEDAINVELGNLSAVHEKFSDYARLTSSFSADTLWIEAGKSVQIYGGAVVTVKQLIAEGTKENPIPLTSTVEGSQGTISQADGTVNAYYLELKDIVATGGATFNAYSSLDLGNVSGWTFFKESQSIDFTAISDKLVTDDPFEISATASSGLSVSFEILSGPATVSGNTITLSGDTGVVQVQASQSGDELYLQAQSVKQSFHVASVTPVDQAFLNRLKVWPNPAKDMLYVNSTSGETIINLKIVDLKGQVVLSSSAIENQVNIQHLEKGYYFILIETSGSISKGNFIKN